ncbi:MAG: PKD domain-containing protein, partial [Bacteroidota bacterium]|nr:PKD domain-containing protein [Bacteroidota bacterium]
VVRGLMIGEYYIVSDELEKAALFALYNSTDGENWIRNKWKVEDIGNYPTVSLAGVTITGGDITSIHLESIGLNGPLPSQINDLSQLTYLSFYANSLTGSIPDLSGLTKLQTLNLGYNFFTGTLPIWIGNLVNLKSLNLSSRQSGGIKLTGPIPSNISILENLHTLNLGYNNLSMAGAIPATFSELDKLHTLDLQGCQLQVSSVNNELKGLNSLKYLNLSNNPSLNINGVFPDILVNLPALTNLTLQQNTFNRFPGTFDQLINLNYLDLSFNNYSNTTRISSIIDTLKNVLSLKTLVLINCQINSLPPDFNQLSTVETLYLSNNNLIPANCDIIGDMPLLNTLHISNCNLTTLPTNIKNSSTLRILNASNNQLSNVPAVLKEIPDLRDLNLSYNGILNLPLWFGTQSMVTLEMLNLNYNLLQTLPQNFTQLTNLVELRINNNKLSGIWPTNFSALNKIETLDLSFNEIADLPDMNSWTSLKTVNLEKNKLSGTLPDFLTNVTSLKTNINIKNNNYNNVTGNAHFSGSNPTVTIGINQFTFEQVIKINPYPGPYFYDPQDSVDIKREVSAFVNGTLTLVAHVDTAIALNCKFQWFKFIDGINDIPLNSSPGHQFKKYSFTVPASEAGSKYYYKITHSSAPKLVLNSRLQNLKFNCNVPPSKVDFEISKQLCAVKFIPDIKYSLRCRTTFYSWDFGDGKKSTEKSPLHVYASSGTFNVTLKMRYSCFPCKGDTTITKSITYNPSDLILKDSIISITTD